MKTQFRSLLNKCRPHQDHLFDVLELEPGHLWDWGYVWGDDVGEKWEDYLMRQDWLVEIVGCYTTRPTNALDRAMIKDGEVDLFWDEIGIRLDNLMNLN